jgi:hypothetical protein
MQRALSGKGPQNSIPRGYCFKFHKGEACSGCEFKHSCFKCDGLHPGLKCNFRGQFRREFLRSTHSAKSGAAPNANLEPYLNGYFADIISTLVSGFTNGFVLHFSGVVNTQEGKNLPSALANPTVVDQKRAKELSALRLAGPFTATPFHSFRVSLLGLVSKKTIGEFRLIHHLSFPHGSSVNDGIATENTNVHYATVADAIRLIKLVGPGCFLA